MALHPFTRRLLGTLGLVAVPSACSTTNPYDCTTPAHTEDLDGCAVDLGVNEAVQKACVNLFTPDGVCPSSNAEVTAALQQNGFQVIRYVCWDPYPSGSTSSTVASSSATGSGGDGSGGGGGASSTTSNGSGGGGGGSLSTSSSASTGTAGMFTQCCYGVVDSVLDRCLGGRPLKIGGEARFAPTVPRTDWSNAELAIADELRPATRAALAAHWSAEAAAEHASVASFACFTLDLLSVGAPSELVSLSARAMQEEIDHARLCYELAGRYGGEPVGPGPLDSSGRSSHASLSELVTAAIVEGCVGETIASLTAARALEQATDPDVRAALAVITRDEANHAELAYRFVAWVIRVGDDATRGAAARAFADALRTPIQDVSAEVEDEAATRHGRLSASEHAAAVREARDAVVRPCAAALLAQAPRVREAVRQCSPV